MARMAISTGKSGPKSVPSPSNSFVLGSRPGSLRAPTPGRIKPLNNQTQYGKAEAGIGPGMLTGVPRG